MSKISPLNFNRSIFIDTSNIKEVKIWNDLGVIDGVTTNQYIMLRDGVKPKEYLGIIKSICKEVKNKPVSIELTNSTMTASEMVKEAIKLDKIAPNIVVKVPLIPESTKSLEVINELIKENIALNITTIMTYEQLIMAILAVRNAKRVSFVSLFWGRSIEDQAKYRSRSDFIGNFPRVGFGSLVNDHPKSITKAAAEFLKEGGYKNPKIIIGSIRSAVMAGDAFSSGANIVTISPDVLMAMLYSQRSIETISQFDKAWKTIQEKK